MAQPPGPYQTADAQRVDNESVKGELRDTSLVESKNVIRTLWDGQGPTAKVRGLTSMVEPPSEVSGAAAQSQGHHLCIKL
jgi:hypothetical protein